MALDYTATGHFLRFGKLVAILETFHRHWKYGWKINAAYPGAGPAYFMSVLNDIFPNSAQSEDETEIDLKNAVKNDLVGAMADLWKKGKGHLEEFLMAYLGNSMQLDKGTIGEGPIVYEYDDRLRSETGQISVSRRGGVLGALARQMSFDGKSIRTNVVVLGAVAARPGNQGVLAEAGLGAGRSHALSGTITMHCIDDTVGRTLLTCEITLSEKLIQDQDQETIGADNVITVGADFEDGPTALSLQMRYGAVVETLDGFNIFSNFVWDKPNETDGDKGKIYGKISRVSIAGPGAIFLVQLFKNANLAAENLIGSREISSIVGTEDITIPGQLSNISLRVDRAAAHATLPAIGNAQSGTKWDLQVPREGDEWTKSVANDELGVFSTKIAKAWRASLNVATGGSENIPDSHAADLALT